MMPARKPPKIVPLSACHGGVLALIMLITVFWSATLKAQTLTGAVVFAAHDSGEYNGLDYWTTGGPSSKLFLKQGEQWLNAPNFSIAIPLIPGLHTFRFFVEAVYSYNPLGLNLFFDGETKTPGISAVTTAEKAIGEKRPFSEIRGKTMRVDTSMAPGAGSLVYTRNDVVVELVGFRFQDPALEKLDFVSRDGTLPNGTPDVVGSITLRVTRRQNGEQSPDEPSVRIQYQGVALSGHRDSVSSAYFSPNGKYVLTVGGRDDGAVKLWTKGGHALFTFTETEPLLAALFSPDSKRILAGLSDGSAAVWDIATHRKLFVMKGHTGAISCMAYSSDGKQIVTGSLDTTVRVWNAANGRTQLLLKGHTAPLTSVAFSPDHRTVLSAGQDKQAKLWDIAPPIIPATNYPP